MTFKEINQQCPRSWPSIEGVYAKNLEVTLLFIDLYIHKKDGANTTSIWSPQKNLYHYNDALQKYETNC